MDEEKAGKNIHNLPVTIEYESLEKLAADKVAVICPDCEGVITMKRKHPMSIELEKVDRCLLCGQTYIFTDIS